MACQQNVRSEPTAGQLESSHGCSPPWATVNGGFSNFMAVITWRVGLPSPSLARTGPRGEGVSGRMETGRKVVVVVVGGGNWSSNFLPVAQAINIDLLGQSGQ